MLLSVASANPLCFKFTATAWVDIRAIPLCRCLYKNASPTAFRELALRLFSLEFKLETDEAPRHPLWPARILRRLRQLVHTQSNRGFFCPLIPCVDVYGLRIRDVWQRSTRCQRLTSRWFDRPFPSLTRNPRRSLWSDDNRQVHQGVLVLQLCDGAHIHLLTLDTAATGDDPVHRTPFTTRQTYWPKLPLFGMCRFSYPWPVAHTPVASVLTQHR